MLEKIFIIFLLMLISTSRGLCASDGDLLDSDDNFIDYPFMKEQILLIAKHIDDSIVTDSSLFYKNKDGYIFNVKVLASESTESRKHYLDVEMFPPQKIPFNDVDIPFFFDLVCSEVIKYNDYILLDRIENFCKIIKEKMKIPFELLKKKEPLDEQYIESCFFLYHGKDFYDLGVEGCDIDYPYEALSFRYSADGKFVFSYYLTLP